MSKKLYLDEFKIEAVKQLVDAGHSVGDVTVLDIDALRVDKINSEQSTVADTEVESFLAEKSLSLTAILKAKGIKVVIYEPILTDQGESEFFLSKVLDYLDEFRQISVVIVANRMLDELNDIKAKVYTRDLFNSD